MPWVFYLAASALLAAIATLIWLFLRIMAKIGELSLKTGQIKDIVAAAAALSGRVDALEQNSKTDSDWPSQAESLNLNRRGQVLRLHRRGDSIPEIASALRLRQGEVKLMIKVHDLVRIPTN